MRSLSGKRSRCVQRTAIRPNFRCARGHEYGLSPSSGPHVIVDPFGKVLAGPLVNERGILLAELDFDLITARKRMFDATGHYNRPEVFRLEVNDRPKPSVITTSDTAEATGTHVTTEEPAQAWSKGSAHAPVDGDAAGAR